MESSESTALCPNTVFKLLLSKCCPSFFLGLEIKKNHHTSKVVFFLFNVHLVIDSIVSLEFTYLKCHPESITTVIHAVCTFHIQFFLIFKYTLLAFVAEQLVNLKMASNYCLKVSPYTFIYKYILEVRKI